MNEQTARERQKLGSQQQQRPYDNTMSSRLIFLIQTGSPVSPPPLLLSRPQRLLQLVPSSALSWPIRLFRLLLAFLCVAVGIGLMIRARLGVAPTDTLNKGFSETVHINFGLAFIVVSGLMYVIGWAMGSRPGPGSIVGSLVIGNVIDVMLRFVDEPRSLTIRAVFYVVGIAFVAVGICLAISTDLGPGPSEVVMLGLHRQGVSLVASRWIVDGAQMAVGFLLGGPLGVGTAIFVVVMAPMIEVGLRWLHYSAPGDVEA
jgi:uncharacterized membrane protein YczE